MSIAEKVQVSEELDQWLRDTRRYLHMNPELSLQEENTARVVAGQLSELGIEHKTGVGGDGRTLYTPKEALELAGIKTGPVTGGTGVVGIIHGRKPGKTILLRADMDALPMDEQNNVEYKSTKPGAMHSCGHDVHTTVLMGVAEVLNNLKDQFDGTVVLMFQPGEEGYGGAAAMINDGLLDDPKVDAALALHVGVDGRAGQISVNSGANTAAADGLEIFVEGIGGHAARPHVGVDTTLVAAQIVVALQSIVSRNVDPGESAVVTIGKLHAGTASNIIPATAKIEGTVRTYNQDVRDHIEKRIKEIVAGIASSMGATAKVAYLRGYPPLFNDPEMADLVREAGTEVLGAENVLPSSPKMAGEDMAFVAERVPTCMFGLGVSDPDREIIYPPHHPRFDADEDALATGVRVMATAALKYLGADAD
jgi:amidohydrolase